MSNLVEFSVWKHFASSQVDTFDQDLDEVQLRDDIRKNIVIPFKDEKLINFVVDFHFYNFSFCKDEAFDNRKISTLMSILNDIFLHDMTTSDPANTMTQSFNKFKDMLLRHSVERPPKRYRCMFEIYIHFATRGFDHMLNLFISIKVYDREEVGKILKFVTDKYVEVLYLPMS